MRGKVINSGVASVAVDRHKQLVDAEVQLLHEFQRWLLSPELVSIRSKIATAASKYSKNDFVEVFLTCTPLSLGRLPWENWDIGTELGVSEKIRIARTPANIIDKSVSPLQRKVRILAILGDDTGLDLKEDKKAVQSLNSIVDVKFVGWRKDTTAQQEKIDTRALTSEIVQAISNPNGWDILFFIGHSNETALTGGEFGIAPGVALSIREIEDALSEAIKRGLQFAIFNSCSGINIAESLISLGLSQVAIMREPIYNTVAQEFLREFLHSLAKYNDVHTALLDACQFLQKQDMRLSYPSAYLVPSLFRHPEAELFRIKPFDTWSKIKRWLPTKREAIWLFPSLLLSLHPTVQDLLLEPRLLTQAVYRKVTFQKPTKLEAPVLLVKIDNQSLQDAQQRYPLDYGYLAKIVQKLSDLEANLVGIDYILSEVDKQPTNATSILRQTLQNTVKKGTIFVFGYDNQEEDLKRRGISNKLASLNWSMQADINSLDWYLELPSKKQCYNSDICPLSYLLALTHTLQTQSKSIPIQPNLQNQTNFLKLITKPENISNQTKYLYNLTSNPISKHSGFFHPIIDFSIPPDGAYKTISACELLGSCPKKQALPEKLNNMLIIIAPGGYDKAGVDGKGEDNATIPLSIAFWRGWGDGKFPKGEAHAYMVHHLLKRHFIVAVPDFIMILIAAAIAKAIVITLIENTSKSKNIIKITSIATVIYFIISLQTYITASILLPLFLPLIIFWSYLRFSKIPDFLKKSGI